jgi:UDP-N-acetylmuramyl pentapeptide phosphotransferase/UDP-N-acetylglucosamine-1-phosphate transferase
MPRLPAAGGLALRGSGAVDDFLNAHRHRIRGRHKSSADSRRVGVALRQSHFNAPIRARPVRGDVEITSTHVVPYDRVIELGGLLFVIIAVIAIVGCSNGVNLTDGLDGLAGGTLAFAFISYMMIALLNDPNQANLALVCALVVGSIVGFLWFNVHPAQIFMGDSGALSLGGMLAVVALITGQVMILPIIGLIFVLETSSDIIQIGSYKLRGSGVFRMARCTTSSWVGGTKRR